MAIIPSANNQLRHVRKTITFTGGAGAGAVGTVTVFTITGRVLVDTLTIFATTGLTGTGFAVFSVGGAGAASAQSAYWVDQCDPNTVATNDWVASGGAVTNSGIAGAVSTNPSNGPHSGPVALSSDLQITVIDDTITAGVLVFDCWYKPISDDGALAGDDIDAGYTPADVKAWLGTAAATPTVAGVPEVDVTHNGGTAITAAAGIQEVKVASVAAAAITAAAIATNAIDADALASNAVDEIWAKAMSDLAAVPGATASVLAGINWLFELARNKRTTSSTTETLYKDDGTTALATSAHSDAAGVFTAGEYS
ncbi:MAG: hypothetical protein C0506_15465 [Anaerolinea sp.]|nr:hypothetical protein [Anaerolinea sp.]